MRKSAALTGTAERVPEHPGRARFAAASALAAAVAFAIFLNLFAQVVSAGHGRDHDSFGWHAFDATAGSAYAICAVIAYRLRAGRWIAWLMVVGSISWTFGTFSTDMIYVSAWWVPLVMFRHLLSVVIVVLVVSFPGGRVDSKLGRVAVGIAFGLLLVNAMVHLVAYDPRALYCSSCVSNPFALISEPRVTAVINKFPLYWSFLYNVGLAVIVLVRWSRGSRPWRAISLLMTIAVLISCASSLYVAVLSLLEVPNVILVGPEYLSVASVMAIPIIYVVGLSSLTQSRARIADVILAASDGIDRADWDRLTREALDDRDARVLWLDASTNGFADAAGAPAVPRSAGGHRVVSAGATIAVIEHDPATAAKHELLASLAESLRLMTENDRLTAELEASLAQVRESRQRLVGAADDARRKIERDLHDGAQQLLLTAALSVEHASRRAGSSADVELTVLLKSATDQLVLARRELRELARGITPAVLDHGGLDAALEELALRSPVPTAIRVDGEGRPSELAETTVYFTVAEALTNIAKHSGATAASVLVVLGDPLALTITDDGIGGATVAAGGGLAGLVDRVEAVGGRLTVSSPVGRGTVIHATVPSATVPSPSLEREPA
ncbi:hypothetical protein BH11ACT3_BH11ACT3_25680 [soil metagenome]